MKGFQNDYATERISIFVGIAIGYIIIVEAISGAAYLLERRWRAER
jgi:glutamate transport system permease protein